MYPGPGARRAVSRGSESHLRHLVHGALLAVVEAVEVGFAEAEHARKRDCGKCLDSRVISRHRGVERAARGGEHVLDVGKLALQLLEVGARLEIGISLA